MSTAPTTTTAPSCPGCGIHLIEPPLHRPRPCPSCSHQSWAIRDGACLVCRHARTDCREVM